MHILCDTAILKVVLVFAVQTISMLALCVLLIGLIAVKCSGIPFVPLYLGLPSYDPRTRGIDRRATYFSFGLHSLQYSGRGKLLPTPHHSACVPTCLTGTASSCQAMISVLIGALAATFVPTPTALSSYHPFHNTDKPTPPPPPFIPKYLKKSAYFRFSVR